MCIFSEKCINENFGFEIEPDGSLKPRKLGRFVLTIEECDEILRERKENAK